MTGQLMEVEKHEMSGDVSCLDIAPVPEGRRRSRFLVASTGGEDGADHPASLFLNTGLQNGVLFRTVVDMVTGQLSDARSRFLGLRAPKLFLL
ncbi:splicing factor 3B subunit 3-like [Olea europaea subsp. europaea]|uniref:Splicing factor 3B subunit 3-like n=1 Tax=Olea europaea subsp. europaea TaxID=158383 RepID=A0A8S0PTB9_OLEEU|nr:splicing factor 3B subunit 3-like [Olea europaea subsp. europaea]